MGDTHRWSAQNETGNYSPRVRRVANSAIIDVMRGGSHMQDKFEASADTIEEVKFTSKD